MVDVMATWTEQTHPRNSDGRFKESFVLQPNPSQVPEVIASASSDADGVDQLVAAASHTWESRRRQVVGSSIERGDRMWSLAHGLSDTAPGELGERVADTRSVLTRMVNDERDERMDGLLDVNERLGDLAAARSDREVSESVVRWWEDSARGTGTWTDHAEWSIREWADHASRPGTEPRAAADALRSTLTSIRERSSELDHQVMVRWNATVDLAVAS